MSKDKSRGFSAFKGKTIKMVDASAINIVYVNFTDGSQYEISAEERHLDIAVLTASVKETHVPN